MKGKNEPSIDRQIPSQATSGNGYVGKQGVVCNGVATIPPSTHVAKLSAVDHHAFSASYGLELRPTVGVPDMGVEHFAGMDRLGKATCDATEPGYIAITQPFE